MKIIPIINTENNIGIANKPANAFPLNAIRIACDGINYIIYEEGDDLPALPLVDKSIQDALVEIARLENLETPRRLAEAMLTEQGREWLENNRLLIQQQREIINATN